MEIIIKKQEAKPLLSREEIEAVMKTEKTPSYAEAKIDISAKLKKQPELIVIKGIYQRFGSCETLVKAYVYNSKEALDKFEPKPKVKKDKAVAESAPAEQAKKPAK